MPPKQQDMSVRDEDQLARDQSLDQLKDQLRASLGYEGGADGLVSMESGELHRFMGELGDKIAEHDRLIVAPPWLAKLQAQVARLEGEVVDLRGSLAESRAEVLELRSALQARPVSPEHGAAPAPAASAEAPPPPAAPPAAALEALERRLRGDLVAHPQLDRRLVALHHAVERADEVAKLDVKAQLVTFGIELDRLRKTVEIAPSAGEIQALKDMYGGKLKALKTFLSEKLTKIERDVRMEASADATRIETALVEGEAKSNEELEALRDQATALGEALEALRDDARRQHGVLDQRITADRQDVDAQLEEARADSRELQDAMKETEDLVQGLQRNLDEAGEREAEVRALLDDAARERDETKAEVQDDFQKLRQALKGVEGRCQRMTKDAEAVERRVDGAEQKLDQTQKRSTAHGAQLKDAAKRLDQLEADLEVVTETDLEDLRADLAAHKEAFASYADATAARLDEHAAAQRATAATVKGYENDVYHVFPGTLREQDAVLAAMKKDLDERGARQDTWNAATAAAHTDLAERTATALAEAGGAGERAALRLATLERAAEETAGRVDRQLEHLRELEGTVAGNHGAVTTAVDALARDSETRFARQEESFTEELATLRDHLKALFETMEYEMSLKIKLAPNSPIHLSAEDQKQLLRHQANECAKVANRFEQRAADDKGCPAALPRDMCRAISLSTEAMADYIARKADVWAVEQQIHGAPEDVAYSDASVEQRRQRIFRNFMELVGEEIAKRHPDAGSLRLEARRKGTQKIAQAIEMSLSKCDMVGVVGHSRLLARRLDVPTCAACDRPLINRRNPYRGPEPPDAPREDVSRPESSLAFAVPSGEMDRVQFRGATRQERVDPLYAKQRDYQRENVRHKKERSDDAAHRPRTVVRGGFRMPQGLGLSEEIQQRMSPNTIEVQRSVDKVDEQDPMMQLPSIPGGSTHTLHTQSR